MKHEIRKPETNLSTIPNSRPQRREKGSPDYRPISIGQERAVSCRNISVGKQMRIEIGFYEFTAVDAFRLSSEIRCREDSKSRHK
jgi:hypothetical protein